MDSRIETHLRRMDAPTQSILAPYLDEPSADAWVRDVLLAYFEYFLRIGEERQSDRGAKKDLLASLKPLVPPGRRRSLDRVEEFLSGEFQRRGCHFLGGMTGPYYGPYIWKRTEKRTFTMELTDRQIDVDVFFLHDFLLRSWMHFQTFGERGTGGWVKRGDEAWDDGLYCVAAAYDLERLEHDPVFQISLLKHEARHFADKTDFPALESADLEYRAKLTEMFYFREMNYRFAHVLREASPAKADSHRYAAYWIVRRLSERVFGERFVKEEERWRAVPYESIQALALELLQAHTEQLRTRPQSTKGILKGV